MLCVSRVCQIDSVDGSNISAFTVHECEAINRVGMRSKRFVFTGHVNGSIQVSEVIPLNELVSFMLFEHLVSSNPN